MNDRAPAEDGSRRTFYFAYGSNMELGPMQLRCPGALVLGPARLVDWAFRINHRGYATLVPQPGRTVHGVLWHITASDEESLDDYEGIAEGLYRKTQAPVMDAGNKPTWAMIYLATHTEVGVALPGYMEAIREAARLWDFPEAYLAELSEWVPR